MKRILIRKPGGHKALELVTEPDPIPGPGQIRVAVRAAGINFADTIVRLGHYPAAKGRYPITPGFEFAGVVDKLGDGTSTFHVGQKVFGFCRFGAYASSLVVEPWQIRSCPEGWDFAECAAIPAVFLTAYYGLFRSAKVEAGETVLVHSAAGGVGLALLQLARAAGITPIGVIGSAHKAEICGQMGAEAVIDRSTQDLWKEAKRLSPKGYDAIFDANGVSTTREGFKHLALGGRLVVYGFAEILPRSSDKPSLLTLAVNFLRVPRFSPLDMTTANRGVLGFNVIFLFDRVDLADKAFSAIYDWMKGGKIKKLPVTRFPLERAADAHAAIESGQTVGKMILTVD